MSVESIAPDTATSAASFEAVLNPVIPRAFAAALSLTGNATEAEDLVQEAALSAWKAFHSFTPGTNFRAWFLRILTNQFYMQYRQERRRRETVSIDAAPDLFLYGKTAELGWHEGGGNPAQTFADRIDGEHVVTAIQKLPADFRVVASLYFVEDLSYREIADFVGCPVGTVRSRLHRARKMLQVMLWEVARDNGLVAAVN